MTEHTFVQKAENTERLYEAVIPYPSMSEYEMHAARSKLTVKLAN
ncbi:hypothetical protein [Paenibacillus wenxiniae]|uniref:Uncharacterized protein n=1 Tax=Paenibacillus wenxiniae TaxID=1636843 RepID=A0ABW4RGW0_9BACL